MSLFENKENIIFFFIYLFVIAIIFLLCLFIIISFFKLLWKIFRRIFNIEKKIKHTKKDITDESKVAKENYEKELRSQAVGNLGGSFVKDKQGEIKEEKDIVKEQREKGEKDIAEGLSQLKKSSLSELPSREEKDEEYEEDIVREKIKIPQIKNLSATSDVNEEEADASNRIEHLKSALATESIDKDTDIGKRIEAGKKFKDKGFINWIIRKIRRKRIAEEEEELKKDEVVISSDLHGSDLFYKKEKIEAARRTKREKDKGWFGTKATDKDEIFSPGDTHNTESPKIAKSFQGDISKKSVTGKEALNTQKDDLIFGGKSEISRTQLRSKLSDDPKVWRAQKQAGLSLSPTERAKLEKEVFSQALGRNISKTDIKWGVKKLNQKMLGAKNIAEKGKLRKQIKFIKKIGGIK